MLIERVTKSIEQESALKVKYFEKIFKETSGTIFDKLSFSISELNENKSVLITKNMAWLEKYISNKLYLYDPVCDWEDNATYYLKNSAKIATEFIDIDRIHDNKNGNMFRDIRRSFKIESGGVSVTYFNGTVLFVGWWSSQKCVKDYYSHENRKISENIIKDILSIYCEEKGEILA